MRCHKVFFGIDVGRIGARCGREGIKKVVLILMHYGKFTYTEVLGLSVEGALFWLEELSCF